MTGKEFERHFWGALAVLVPGFLNDVQFVKITELYTNDCVLLSMYIILGYTGIYIFLK